MQFEPIIAQLNTRRQEIVDYLAPVRDLQLELARIEGALKELQKGELQKGK